MDKIIEKGSKILKGNKWLAVSDGVMIIILLAVIAGFYFEFRTIENLKSTVASTNEVLSTRIKTLEADLATTTLASKELSKQLSDQQAKTSDFAQTINDISGTVGTLEKLSKTDKELLQKYSRVYFLSDNYVPLSLQNIDSDFLNDPTKTMQFHTSALQFLRNMLTAARTKDINIKVVSAYRSFGTQSSLKASYLTTYGSGANQFSADQGYSEHQLGTAVDLTVDGQNPDLTIAFDATPAFAWLTANAYRYGFILSYPKGNAYYQYEPWHWRFVGRSLATRLHREGQNFTDLDQRDIDTYLANIFD